jgi:hypothetical protein
MAIATPAFAQKTDAQRINRKVAQVMLYNQILPLILTKAQVKAILPSIEAARESERKLAAEESKVLARNEAKLDAILAAAKKDKRIPSNDEMAPVKSMIAAMTTTRQVMVNAESQKVSDALAKVCNKGQIKAAANSFDPRWFDRTLDPAKMTEADKVRLFVRLVLMDPEAYPILVELSK